MEKILDRFLRYVSIDTQSNEESESQPSTEKQWNLLRMLRNELEAMGVEATLDECCGMSSRRWAWRPRWMSLDM